MESSSSIDNDAQGLPRANGGGAIGSFVAGPYSVSANSCLYFHWSYPDKFVLNGTKKDFAGANRPLSIEIPENATQVRVFVPSTYERWCVDSGANCFKPSGAVGSFTIPDKAYATSDLKSSKVERPNYERASMVAMWDMGVNGNKTHVPVYKVGYSWSMEIPEYAENLVLGFHDQNTWYDNARDITVYVEWFELQTSSSESSSLTKLSSSSTISTSSSQTESSSLYSLAMQTPTYSVSPEGGVYEFDPATNLTDCIFNDVYDNNYAARGIAVKDGKSASGEPIIQSSSSSEGLGSADAGEWNPEDHVFYIIRNIGNSKASISVRRYTKEYIGYYTFDAADDFIAMTAWPADGNILVAITKRSFYFIDLDKSPIEVKITRSDVVLSKGITLKGAIDEFTATFVVPNPSFPRRVNEFTLNRASGSVVYNGEYEVASGMLGPDLPMSVRGISYYEDQYYSAHAKDTGTSYICTYYEDNLRTCSPFLSIKIADIAHPVSGLAVEQVTEEEEVITVTNREYDYETSDFIQDTTHVAFGAILPGVKSDIRVVDMSVSNVEKIKNVKAGLVNFDLECVDYGNQIEWATDSELRSDLADSEFEPFPGINTSNSFFDPNNVDIGSKTAQGGTETESQYLYLRINAPLRLIGEGHFTVHWFFDYE